MLLKKIYFIAFGFVLVSSFAQASFGWKKATESEDDLRALHSFHKDVHLEDDSRSKFLGLPAFSDNFDDFQKKFKEVKNGLESNKRVKGFGSDEEIYIPFLNINEFSGYYLFYPTSKREKLVGVVIPRSKNSMHFIDQDIFFLASSPKGIGTYALDILTQEFLKLRGKEMNFLCEDKTSEESTFILEKSCPHYLQATIHYENVPSLICHLRAGFAPFVHMDSGKEKICHFIYPPYEKEGKYYNSKLYEGAVLPCAPFVEKLTPVFEKVCSKKERKKGLQELENLIERTKGNFFKSAT